MKWARTRSDPGVLVIRIAQAHVSRSSSARLLQAPPPLDLGTLIGDFHALVLRGASDADTAQAAAQICRALRTLSAAEVEVLGKVAQGMPAGPAGRGPDAEDEDADPVGRAK